VAGDLFNALVGNSPLRLCRAGLEGVCIPHLGTLDPTLRSIALGTQPEARAMDL